MNQTIFIKMAALTVIAVGLIYASSSYLKAQDDMAGLFNVPNSSSPPLVVSDNFNRADASNLGSNWTVCQDGGASGIQVLINKATGIVSANQVADYWSANSFSNNQYSKVTIGNVSAGTKYVAPCVRMSGNNSTANFYAFFNDGSGTTGSTSIYKIVNGVLTDLQDYSFTSTTGDTIELHAVGTTLSVYLNGVHKFPDITDSTFSSGNSGMSLIGNIGVTVTYWEGGNL